MTGTTANKGTAGAGEPRETGAGNVEKIRDILFGNQMRDYERKFAHLEERIMSEVSRLREETGRRMEALEGYVNQEFESLGGRLKGERQDRAEADRKLEGELAGTSRSQKQKLNDMEERFGATSRELRQQILEQSRTLRDELARRCEETARVLDRATGELRAEKMDRSALAGMLTSLAMQISGGEGSASGATE